MILITGATGTVGSEIIRLLSARRIKSRALVRDVGKADKVRLPFIELVEGDLDKPETIERALRGIDRLFLLSPLDPRQVERELGAVEAARLSEIKHIVKLSVFGAITNPTVLSRPHREIEEKIEKSKIPFTHLRPNFFMQNVLGWAAGITGGGAVYVPLKDGRISMVDVRDIAAVAVKVLTEDGHERKAYDITGPEALGIKDVTEKLSKAVGRKIKYVDVPPEEAQKSMLEAGMPDWKVEQYLALFDSYAQGKGAAVSGIVKLITGVEPRTFDAFAREFAPAFAQVKKGDSRAA